METILKRFSVVGEKILKNLDGKSLARSKKASRGIAEFLENKKFYFISIIKKYKGNFKGFEKSWNEVIHKSQIKIIRQLAIAVQLYFKTHPFQFMTKEAAPLLIAVKESNIKLCEYIISKTSNKNPADTAGWTPLHEAASWGHFDVCRLIIENVDNKNPTDKSGWTLLHSAAYGGNLDLCRFIIENVDNKNPVDNNGRTPKDIAKAQWANRNKLIQLFEA